MVQVRCYCVEDATSGIIHKHPSASRCQGITGSAQGPREETSAGTAAPGPHALGVHG